MSRAIGMLGLAVCAVALSGCALQFDEAYCTRHLVPINLPAPDQEARRSDPPERAPMTPAKKARP